MNDCGVFALEIHNNFDNELNVQKDDDDVKNWKEEVEGMKERV